MVGVLLRLHDALTRLTFWAAALSVAYLTVVTAWEVVARYAFRAPTDWAPDTSAVSFAFVTFLAAPMLTWQSGHATMTFIVEKSPATASVWMIRFSLLVGAAACGLCAWFAGVETVRLYERGVTMIAVTPIPKWLVIGVMVYGLASMALYFTRQLVESFRPVPVEDDRR